MSSLLLSLVTTLALVCLNEFGSARIVPPKFVYRADFRGPSTIFKHGLQHIGDNINILDHVLGGSCSYGPYPSTAFVATTSEEAFAEKWGADQLWLDRFSAGDIVQIYKIRATSDFYDCYESLMASSKKIGNKRLRVDYTSTAARYQYQKEWLAHKGIPKELIVSARVFDKDQVNLLQLKFLRFEENPDYVDADTEANSSPFNDQGSSPKAGGTVSYLTSRLPFLSSCFGSCPSGNKADEPSTLQDPNPPAKSCPTNKIVFAASFNASMATVWDPVDQNRREMIVPWEEETIIKGHVVEKPKSCSVNPGTNGVNFLQINCTENTFFDSFVVLLRAGLGSQLAVDSKHTDGVTSHPWKKNATTIPLAKGSGFLSEYKVKISDVFTRAKTGKDKGFWSEIRIYPVYPDYAPKMCECKTYG